MSYNNLSPRLGQPSSTHDSHSSSASPSRESASQRDSHAPPYAIEETFAPGYDLLPPPRYPVYANHLPAPPSQFLTPHYADDYRRDSGATLIDEREDSFRKDTKFSFSSYRHPYDIPPPSSIHTAGQSWIQPYRPVMPYSGHDDILPAHHFPSRDGRRYGDQDQDDDLFEYKDQRSRGVLAQLVELRDLDRRGSDASSLLSSSRRRPGLKRLDSLASQADEYLEPDDPHVTGKKSHQEECDPQDLANEIMRAMNYRQRRKEKARVVIEFNITSMVNRQNFLLKLARALMTFGAPSHRVESQLLACARILEVNAEFIHIPGIILCSYGDPETKTSETHVVKCGGGLALGNLHRVHQIYRAVVHDEICAKAASAKLAELLHAKPVYTKPVRIVLAFSLSALICPLAFGGSFLDMWIAGLGAIIISFMRLVVASRSQLYANLLEITMAMLMSFIARALSSIKGDFFCYSAISSAAIVSILPGYLILRSSLELASKNIVCGSINMVYALFYTLCLGFSIQMGSDFYLIFDRSARRDLDDLTSRMAVTIDLTGIFNFTTSNVTSTGIGTDGTFAFTHNTPYVQEHIVEGCFRPPTSSWYLRTFPSYTQYPIVPLFSILSSLANLQPWRSRELPVMVVISCVSYAANKVSNHYIFNRSDIVSAIGAFAVGVLGNAYSRKMGGTAFTSMVTGVLFLVPSGLSQAGGMTAGNSIDIGGSMIAVTIGITVGLFMSQAFVYMFGTRKGAAVFSF